MRRNTHTNTQILSSTMAAISQNRRTLTTTPSQKSLSHLAQTQTQGSHADLSSKRMGMGMKRFTRKNNVGGNTSVEKQKTRLHTTFNAEESQAETKQPLASIANKTAIKYCRDLKDSRISEKSISISKDASREVSKQIYRNNDADADYFDNRDNKIRHHRHTESMGKAGSFKMNLDRAPRYSDFNDDERISQEKYSSRNSIANRSIDSRSSHANQASKSKTKQINTQNITNTNTLMTTISVLKTQIQLKDRQIQMLEDERRRYRNIAEENKKKQSLLLQKVFRYQNDFIKIQQMSKQLQHKLQSTISELTIFKQANTKISNQLNECQKNLKIHQQQLNTLQKRILPKNVLEFQSCRQISLENTIKELKERIDKSKCQVIIELQKHLSEKSFEVIQLKNNLKSLQIKNRILEKKGNDCQRYLEAYKAVKQEMKQLKTEMRNLRSQGDLLRKQNVRLKKEIKDILRKNVKKENKPKEQRFIEKVSPQKSLNLSLSVCSFEDKDQLPIKRNRLRAD